MASQGLHHPEAAAAGTPCIQPKSEGLLMQESRSSRTTHKKTPPKAGFLNKSLTTTYSHMGRPHTTIGAESFHC